MVNSNGTIFFSTGSGQICRLLPLIKKVIKTILLLIFSLQRFSLMIQILYITFPFLCHPFLMLF